MISPVLPTYQPIEMNFTHGEGVYLYTTDGRRFLDFYSGIGVMAFGHSHPHLVEALTTQGRKLWHLSNAYRIPGQLELAERYVANTFADTVFFTNSGAEAWEAGLKIVRKYFSTIGQPERFRLITMEGCFHGRTMGGISASQRGKMIDGFGPLLDGFDVVPAGDLDAVAAAVTPHTAAVHLEPILGEGGVMAMPQGYLQGLRELCDRHGLLLFLDEIQSGAGRTGKFLASEWAGISPDVCCMAKGIGGGFPLGAALATEKAAVGMVKGTHGSTYGGNPLAMAVGNAVLDEILAPGFLDRVQQMAEALKSALEAFAKRNHNSVATVRGRGLMLGVKLREGLNNRDVIRHLLSEGLMLAPAGDNVLRFLPPLILEEAHIAEAMEILDRGLAKLADQAA